MISIIEFPAEFDFATARAITLGLADQPIPAGYAPLGSKGTCEPTKRPVNQTLASWGRLR